MPVTFKDFDKDVKDLLTKNYQNGTWKLESKLKGPKDALYINPIVEKGVVSADLQYDLSCCPVKTKVSVEQSGKVKDKVTWESDFGTVEVQGETVVGGADCCQKWTTEVSHEYKNANVNVKTTVSGGCGQDTNANVGVVYDVNKTCAVGFNVALKNFALKEWTAATRYVSGGIFFALGYNAAGAINVSAKYPLEVVGRKVTLATQVTKGKDLKYTFGGETECILCKGAQLRFKCTPGNNYGFAWVKKIGAVWKAAASLEWGADRKPKFGVLLTQE